eukprot:scaffold211850_cov46-Tisochrysis_lutea.AAC.1
MPSFGRYIYDVLVVAGVSASDLHFVHSTIMSTVENHSIRTTYKGVVINVIVQLSVQTRHEILAGYRIGDAVAIVAV